MLLITKPKSYGGHQSYLNLTCTQHDFISAVSDLAQSSLDPQKLSYLFYSLILFLNI